MTTFLYRWYVYHKSCILVSDYTCLFSQRYWGRLERSCVIPSIPATFLGGVAPGCLLDPRLRRVTAGYSLPRAGSPVRKAPGKATLTHAVVWNKQTSKYHSYLLNIYIVRPFRSINTYWGNLCRLCAQKCSDICLAFRYLWERLATKQCTGWLWELTGSEQNDHFVDMKPIINRASESVEEISLFVHVSVAMIFIDYG